jgi:hypothetical protein
MPDFNKYVTYDNQGNILTEMKTNANTGDTTERYVNTYDAQERLIKSILQFWMNGNWENIEQYYYEFDNHDNLTISLHHIWQAGNWVAMDGQKYIYTYDNNNITEEIAQNWNSWNTSWVNNFKHIFTYDVNGYISERVYQTWDVNLNTWNSSSKETYTVNGSGAVTEVIMLSWDNINSAWVNQEKHTNILWYNWTGELIGSKLQSMTALNWNSGVWENWFRINCTYDALGGCVRIQETYFNSTWVNATKYTQSYDEHGNLILNQNEFWINNAWVIDMGNKYLLTYNGNNVTQKIEQMWNQLEWINTFKEEYSDFANIQGFNNYSNIQTSVHFFPNPSYGILNLEVENTNSEPLLLEIANMSGQTVYRKQLIASDFPVYKIDLSSLKKGIYIVIFQNTYKVSVGKIIIQ